MYDLVYYCDSYPDIGNGHLARGSAILQNMLSARNLKCVISGIIADSGKDFLKRAPIANSVDLNDDRSLFDSRLAVIDNMFFPGDADTIDETFSKKVKAQSQFSAAISSGFYPKINPSIDLLFDHLPDASPKGDTSQTEIRKGFQYLPVNFSKDKVNLAQEELAGDTVLSIIGGGAQESSIVKLVTDLFQTLGQLHAINFVLSTHYSEALVNSLQQKFDLPHINFFQNLSGIGTLFKKASFIITTYGNATYEALKLNKICFTVAIKEFQHEYGAYLEKKGLVFNLGYIDEIATDKLIVDLNSDEVRNIRKQIACYDFKNAGLHNISNHLLMKEQVL